MWVVSAWLDDQGVLRGLFIFCFHLVQGVPADEVIWVDVVRDSIGVWCHSLQEVHVLAWWILAYGVDYAGTCREVWVFGLSYLWLTTHLIGLRLSSQVLLRFRGGVSAEIVSLHHRPIPTSRNSGRLFLQLKHLLLLPLVNGRQVILNDIILPIIDCSISLDLLVCILLVFYIHSCIILVITDFEFLKLFSKEFGFAIDLLFHERGILFFHDFHLLPIDEFFDSLMFLEPVLLFG